MKKLVLLLLVTTFTLVSTFAANPDFFTFEIGSGAAYDVEDGEIASSTLIGFSYMFDQTFGGGFSFAKVGDIEVNAVSITISPVEDVTMTMFTGQVGGLLGFGAGVGYDFFTKKNSLFSSLGFYMNWFASNGASLQSDGATAAATNADVANGGVLTMGLKTRIGL